MDAAEFWSTKRNAPRWQTIAIAHEGFAAPYRLVANVFAPVTLGGNEYEPVPMTIQPPDQGSDPQPRLMFAFPRIAVGRQFKAALRLIEGSRSPISVTYGLWLSDTDAPKVTWLMYASDKGGITFDGASVQVTATLDNPMRRRAAPIYDPNVFTGLETL
jgi:hypothetical protein